MGGERQDWWVLELAEDMTLDRPGIYEWRIGGESVYVGKSSRLPGRLREYPNNVRKLLAVKSYRKSNPEGYREIHHRLRDACVRELCVTVTVLENCEHPELNLREQVWIARRRAEALKGGPKVLNGSAWEG